MAKPSVTNIRPPTTPPKTAWDLNTAGDRADVNYHENTGSSSDLFDTLVPTLNIPAHGPSFNFQDYGYVFYGVNGGMDETVVGNNSLAGVIVTGNGKDNITGGQYDDIVFAGNGKDVVNGAGGNDILFGENGADQLDGGSDEGSANFGPGGTVLTVIPGTVAWDHDPNGDSDPAAIPSKTTVSKDGFYVALDGGGHPTEFDGNGNPVVHVVYDVTPESTGWYTIAYTQGNGLDGPGEPAPDQFQVFLTAGNTYHYSFIYDPGHSTVRADVFAGQIVITNPINDGPGGNPNSVATSQALPDPGWETFFTVEDGPEVKTFNAGDHLVGGNGPDQFIWNAADTANVDLIWDYNQSAGGPVDPTEGDVLVLKGVLANLTDTNNDNVIDKFDLTTFMFDVDNNANTPDALVIYLGQNQAVGLAGITDINQVNILFA